MVHSMTPHIQPGTKLGRYEIHSHIGAGGMGDVYLARDTEFGPQPAIQLGFGNAPTEISVDQRPRRTGPTVAWGSPSHYKSFAQAVS